MSVVKATRYRHDPTYDRVRVDLDLYAVEMWRTLLEAVERHRPPAIVQMYGACVGEDTALFFPSRKDKTRREARVMCRRCTVADECRAWAERQGPTLEGTWAGTSWADRRERRAVRGPLTSDRRRTTQ